MKLNEAACLKIDISSFQVVTYRLAKLVGYANSFPDQQRQHATRILFSFLEGHILLSSPCGIPDAIQGIPEIRQNLRVSRSPESNTSCSR